MDRHGPDLIPVLPDDRFFEVTTMAKGMLLVGHGSSMPYNQELIEKTAEFIKAKNSGYIVKCGFMNINKPTIKESLEAFLAS